jgi:DNA-binding response OmpR family regulator
MCAGANRSIIMKKILIVDDEPDVNLTLKVILEEGGFHVDTFNDPLVALV